VTDNIKSGGKVWSEAEDEKCETNGISGDFFLPLTYSFSGKGGRRNGR
jgi:hypothetical protein